MSIPRIKKWLKKHNMTEDDIGVDVPIEQASDEIIQSILDDIHDEEAEEEYDLIMAEEAEEYEELGL